MKRILGAVGVGLLLAALVATSADARGQTYRREMTQQTTSDGDSLSANPDTSVAIDVPSDITAFGFAAEMDTAGTFTVQVSTDGTTWRAPLNLSQQDWTAVAITVANSIYISGGEVSFPAFVGAGTTQVRVIMDNASSATKFKGRSWIWWTKD